MYVVATHYSQIWGGGSAPLEPTPVLCLFQLGIGKHTVYVHRYFDAKVSIIYYALLLIVIRDAR